MAGRIQNDDLKSVAELAAQGCGPERLPNDTKIWVTANGIAKTLYQAIVDGNLSGGGGGGGSGTVVGYTYSNGNIYLTLRPVTTALILQASDSSLWSIQVDTSGNLSANSVGSGTPNPFNMTRPDTTIVTIGVTPAGELQITDPATSGTVNDFFYLADSGGTAWRLAVTNLDEITTTSGAAAAAEFDVQNNYNATVFSVKLVGGLKGLVYASVFNSTDLPATPATIANTLPMAIYDNGTDKKPIYWNGTKWTAFDSVFTRTVITNDVQSQFDDLVIFNSAVDITFTNLSVAASPKRPTRYINKGAGPVTFIPNGADGYNSDTTLVLSADTTNWPSITMIPDGGTTWLVLN